MICKLTHSELQQKVTDTCALLGLCWSMGHLFSYMLVQPPLKVLVLAHSSVQDAGS